jgi:hypothetical protein
MSKHSAEATEEKENKAVSMENAQGAETAGGDIEADNSSEKANSAEEKTVGKKIKMSNVLRIIRFCNVSYHSHLHAYTVHLFYHDSLQMEPA